MRVRLHWWVWLAGVLVLVHALVSWRGRPGFALNAFSDLTDLCLLLLAAGVTSCNAVRARGLARAFWILLAAGMALWSFSLALWSYHQVWLHRDLPDPFVADVILFIHVVPIMAAVALRPHRRYGERKLLFTVLNFILLLLWWVYLYTFVVFPDQYVYWRPAVYNSYYDRLYLLENLVVLLALGVLAARVRGPWRTVYGHLFAASFLYTLSSQLIDRAIESHHYYTGSLYDVPFVVSICWFIWAALLGGKMQAGGEPLSEAEPRQGMVASRLAMLAVLSMPVLVFWALFMDPSPPRLRQFRVVVTLAAMLVLGACVFVKQQLLDGELTRLLAESRGGLEKLRRAQGQLLQQEKLASLGRLVAGAAHEINNPLTAILGYSDLLISSPIPAEQISVARKIGHQARRTRDLVSDLLSFAERAPAEKTLLDPGSLLNRAVHMARLQLSGKEVWIETRVPPDLPRIYGSPGRLFEVFLHLMDNAVDVLQEVGGGLLTVRARQENAELVIEFSDNGPGIREPHRVFDPFYTTKPVGRGAGLGLSVCYGVLQDHKGQISCYNRREGGAVFVLRLPAAPSPVFAGSITLI